MIKSFQLAGGKRLLELTLNDTLPGVTKSKPMPCLILDRSGSMGQHCQRAVTVCLPDALTEQGYASSDEITLVTFDTSAERVYQNGKNPTVSDLRKRSDITSRGSTNMCGAIKLLDGVLQSGQSQSYHIVVISDGEISDSSTTFNEAQLLRKKVQPGLSISVSLLRTKTSSYSQPDTRAMTCIGMLNTSGVVQVVDVDMCDGEASIPLLTSAISHGCEVSGVGSSIVIEDKAAIFMPTPTSEPVSSVKLPCIGKTYILLNEHRDTIVLGGVEYPVIDAGVPQKISDLEAFIHFSTQPLKMSMLVGGSSADLKKQIETTLSFLEQTEALIKSVHNKALETGDISIIGRARKIAETVKANAGSIIAQLRSDLNIDRVAGLNSQQTADFLRSVPITRGGKALARRTEGSDFVAESSEAIVSLAKIFDGPDAPKETSDDPRSFYCFSTFYECLLAACVLAPVAQNLGMKWLETVGGLGVPFFSHVGDLPMPFSFRIEDLYAGQVLAEPDVWMACVQSGEKTGSIDCPGRPGKKITGVITLRSTDPECYDIYHKSKLSQQQSSAQMRHVVACVGYEKTALTSAGILWLLEKMGQTELSTVEKTLLESLTDNLNVLVPDNATNDIKTFSEDLLRADPRPWLSGDRNFCDVLQGFAAMTRFKIWNSNASRALYSLETYHRARRFFRNLDNGTREAALHDFLSIDFKKHGTPIQPLFVDEPAEPRHNETCYTGGPFPVWAPKTYSYEGLQLTLKGNGPVFGNCDTSTFQKCSIVQALLSTEESSRIDTATRTSKLPDISSNEEADAYLKSVTRKIYADEYATRVVAKKKEENAIRTDRACETLTKCDDSEFVQTLQNSVIVNRDHPGYERVLTAVLNSRQLWKAFVLLTGRTPEKTTVPVWAKGNMYSPGGGWVQIEAKFENTDTELLAVLKAVRAEYGTYKYPRGNNTNRHGHSDTFVSYWAMGFKDLVDMKIKVSDETFQKYINEHCIKNGCCGGRKYVE